MSQARATTRRPDAAAPRPGEERPRSKPRAPRRGALLVAALAAATLPWLLPGSALGHGIATLRRERPIPDWLFGWGAAVVLVVSFAALALAWRRPLLQDDRWRPLAWSGARWHPLEGVRGRVAEALAGLLGVGVLALVLWAGLSGTPELTRNVAPTIVFVVVWVGAPLASALLGDVTRPLNPWRALGRLTSTLLLAARGGRPLPHLPYPARLGRWPAVAGLVGFVALELLYEVPGGPRLESDVVATAAAVYTGWTLVGMAAFGVDRWLDRGETFAVLFALYGRMSPLERRDGRLGLRRPLSGLAGWPDAPGRSPAPAAAPGAVALVLTAIGTTAFDGAQEGVLADPQRELFGWLLDRGWSTTAALRASSALLLAGCVLLVAAIYWTAMVGARRATAGTGLARDARSTLGGTGAAFAHAFVPIALAYLLAHDVGLLLFQGQALPALLSDPRGDGADLLGTASWGIDYGLIDAEGIWYLQVGALVVGHVLALVLAHDRALALYGHARAAARSQRWMLGLMVAFTVGGLWLISRANA